MQIDVTVSGPAGRHDVRIVAPVATPASAVRPQIAAVAGAAPDAVVLVHGRELDAAVTLDAQGVGSGAILSVGAVAAPARSATLALHVVSGPDAGRVVPLGRGRFSLGRAASCDVELRDDGVSRAHATLTVTPTRVSLCDLGSTNGTTVDGAPCRGDVPVAPGQLIGVGESLLALAAPPTTQALPGDGASSTTVRAASRPATRVPAVEIRRPEPPPRTGRVQWLACLAPLVVGAAVAWATHSALFLLFAVLSPVMMLSTAFGDGWHGRRRRREYRGALARCAAEIHHALDAEGVARRSLAPDPAVIWSVATARTARLWERRRTDPDFLHLRLGTATLPSIARVRDGAASDTPAGSVRTVPMCVDLGARPVGLAGPSAVVAGMARWLVGQLATFHSPADIRLALLLTSQASSSWSWARWLPHVGDRVAFTAGTRHDLVRELGAQQLAVPDGPDASVVLVVETDVSGLAELVAAGASAIWVGAGEPPAWCTTVVRIRGDTGTRALVTPGDDGPPAEVVVERVGARWSEEVARSLAPLVDARGTAGSPLPDRCELLDLLGLVPLDADAIAAAWQRSRGAADTVLGATADGPLRIDLDTDGPHGLVAGTTGAGKSRLLQCLVAGLAARHPPDEMTFLLVDYKGGAAFDACVRLPHTTGVVTDLDPHLTRRALESLDAELRRRERILAAAGADDLPAYRNRGARDAPLPRLVIVVDEFAALADELPEFVRGLVSVAQRGRSMGVHLVLATQRPGTAVTPDIRANTGLRIALRVTGAAESVDIVDIADAASIPRSAPGRAYLRRGPEVVAFQTARVGTGAPPRPEVLRLGEWRRPLLPVSAEERDGDGLRRLVDAVSAAATTSSRTAAIRPWCPPLPARLAASTLDPVREPVVAIGLLDRPAEQAQPALTLDLAGGESVVVAGASRSGRSTALLALGLAAAAALAPAHLAMYVVDPGGALADGLAGVPHVATCLGPGQLDLVPSLLHRLTSAPFRSSLVLLDEWDVVLGQDDTGSVAAAFDQLARAGRAAGVTIAAGGGRGLLSPRTTAAFGTRLVLRLSDRADYALAGIAGRCVPALLPPGRGVRAADGTEFQLLWPDDALRHAATRWREPLAAGAIRLRPLPATIALTDLLRDGTRATVGVGGDDAAPVRLELRGEGATHLLIAGPPRSGRSTTLRTLLVEGRRIGLEVVVAAPARSPLREDATRCGVRIIAPGDDPDDPRGVGGLLLVDDSEEFADTAAGDRLASWLRRGSLIAAVVARSDDLAAAYRGLAAEARRHRRGVLLNPGPVDGELLGVRLPRARDPARAGRGVLVGAGARPIPIQVATPC